jgi:hypothetical protein
MAAKIKKGLRYTTYNLLFFVGLSTVEQITLLQHSNY